MVRREAGVVRRFLAAAAILGITCAAPGVRAQPEGASPAPAPVEVSFPGAGGLELKGELLVPGGERGARWPAVVLLPGSGPTDRNGNQPPLLVTDLLKQVAERLAADGVASLRFDKRATMAYREKWPAGAEAMSEFFSFENFVGDAAGAVAFLRGRAEVDPRLVGMVGHSEGGLIALQVAHDAVGKDGIAALILMSTAGRTLAPVIREQIAAQLKRQGADEATTKAYVDATDRAIEMVSKEGKIPSDLPAGLGILFNPTALKLMRSYCTVDPAELAGAYEGPVLIVQGEKDIQVSAERDAPRLKEVLEKRGKGAVEMMVVTGASHNLKTLRDESDMGFAGPVAEGVLERISTWTKAALKD